MASDANSNNCSSGDAGITPDPLVQSGVVVVRDSAIVSDRHSPYAPAAYPVMAISDFLPVFPGVLLVNLSHPSSLLSVNNKSLDGSRKAIATAKSLFVC